MKYFKNLNLYQKFVIAIFFIGLIYMLLPGASSINNLPPLPGSTKSNLEGDTIQNPNIAAYFSDYRRGFITTFYREKFEKNLLFGIRIPSIAINHPPEAAYTYVRDQQESTFLEEYVYPLRESFFVNGYEPLIENRMFNKVDSETDVANFLHDGDSYFNSKATIRYYPSNIFLRTLNYLLFWIAILGLYKLSIKVIKE